MTEIIERPATTGPITAPNWGLTKFLDPPRIPPVFRAHGRELITIPMVTTRQRPHSEFPKITLWTYAGHFPGRTIEVRSGRQLRISWSNEIDGEFPLVAVQGPLDDAPTSRPGRELDKKDCSIPFSGPFALVNGVIWPHLDVDARWYRFRLLNAANSRFYTLNVVDENNAGVNDAVRLIGTDGGLLPAPVRCRTAG